jgi:hypothetical protein
MLALLRHIMAMIWSFGVDVAHHNENGQLTNLAVTQKKERSH